MLDARPLPLLMKRSMGGLQAALNSAPLEGAIRKPQLTRRTRCRSDRSWSA